MKCLKSIKKQEAMNLTSSKTTGPISETSTELWKMTFQHNYTQNKSLKENTDELEIEIKISSMEVKLV